ncbi:hypothetical protein GBAR_LOCUS25553 [Geodia barretti]|uniref:Uncharacterized protein n=1 Tax=Geodia barretti TaxID=519541 RepID=A0AA35TDD0_GEOBA|nr:hypothetical protein GBAR_LOCUS25553 [Geodia barretti]
MGHQLHDDFEFPGDNGCRVPSDQLRFSLSRYIGCFPTASLMGIATGGSSSVPGSSGLWYPLHLHFRATAASFQHSGCCGPSSLPTVIPPDLPPQLSRGRPV